MILVNLFVNMPLFYILHILFMPYKHNARTRYKFKKSTYKVTNWTEYNEVLRRWGDVTIWFIVEAIKAWVPEKTGCRGRPKNYSDIAIEVVLF